MDNVDFDAIKPIFDLNSLPVKPKCPICGGEMVPTYTSINFAMVERVDYRCTHCVWEGAFSRWR